MATRKPGDPLYSFQWFFRNSSPPFVRVVEEGRVELSREQLAQALQDMPPRQWDAVKQLLLEAKFKCESQLRDESVISDSGRLAYYTGWLAYADYVLAGFVSIRSAVQAESETF
jgi:hypothetical protein